MAMPPPWCWAVPEISGCGLVSAAGIGVAALAEDRARGLRMPVSDAFEAAELAIAEALDQAALPGGARVGLALGTALGGLECGEPYRPPSDLTTRLARQFSLSGPVTTYSVTCASSLYALEQACFDLESGRADAMLCGGIDTVSRFMAAGFASLGAQIRLGEAACFVVLQRAAARPLARVLGRGLRSDGTHLTSPDSSGKGMLAAIAQATPSFEGLAAISVTARDAPAYQALYERVLAKCDAARVTSWEPEIGHVLAASGMLGLVHATLLLPELDGDLLALTVGFGGQNGAMRVALP